MATLNLSDIQTTGGILHPNLRHRFIVEFANSNGDALAISKELSSQVINVSSLSSHREWPHGHITITFQDDMVNNAIKGLIQLQQLTFDILVHQMDGGDKVLRTTKLKNAVLNTFTQSKLDYEDRANPAILSIDATFPDRIGEAVKLLDENPVAAGIISSIGGAKVQMQAYPSQPKVSEFYADFEFDQIEYLFK